MKTESAISTNRTCTLRILALLVVTAGILPATAGAQVYVTDQQQPNYTSGGGAIAPSWTAFGQSFTPTLNSIQWAAFTLQNQSSPFAPINLSLSILDGQVGGNGLGGTVLATSPTVSLTSTSLATLVFQLSSPLALTPGNQYVLEVNILTQNEGLGWEQGGPYSGGQMLQSPYPTSLLTGQQYVFSEGIITAAPEPCTLALAGLGILSLLRFRRRK